MTQENEKRSEVLELLRSLPHPGKVLLDFVGEGISNFSLGIYSVPQKMTGKNASSCYSVEFQLIQNGYSQPHSDSRPFRLDSYSNEWKEWIGKKTPFVLLASDVGQEISVIEERERNFNKNLLREFLEGIHISITIDPEENRSLLDYDNYPVYFWDKATCVSGTFWSNEMNSIVAKVKGLESHPAIEVDKKLYLKYWHFLTNEQRPAMQVIVKWHKALVSLHHLLKKGDINIPIDYLKLKENCWNEINTVYKG